MLYQESVSSAVKKQKVARAIARGLANQWLGVREILSSWLDVLLGEGLVRYVENIGIEAVSICSNIFKETLNS